MALFWWFTESSLCDLSDCQAMLMNLTSQSLEKMWCGVVWCTDRSVCAELEFERLLAEFASWYCEYLVKAANKPTGKPAQQGLQPSQFFFKV